MTVEINYFAWEENKHKGDEFASVYTFVKYAPLSRIKNGYLACQVIHQKGWSPWVSYELLAEDANTKVSKLCRIIYSPIHIYEWREYDVPFRKDSAFNSYIQRIPEYQWSDTDYMPPPFQKDWQYLIVRVGTQPDIYFEITPMSSNYSYISDMTKENLWSLSVMGILNLCDEITNIKKWYRSRVEETFESYRHLFRKKTKHAKYNGKWSRPKPPEYSDWDDRYYKVDREILRSFVDVDLKGNWKSQLDFKYYLPGFMRLLSLHHAENTVGALFLFQKIAETDFPSWDADEQATFHNYLGALMDYILVYFPSISMDILTFIQGVQTIDGDVERYVNHWKSKSGDVAAMRHLAWTVNHVLALYSEIGNDAIEILPDALHDWLREVYADQTFVDLHADYDGVRPFATEFDEAHTALDMLIEAGL